MKFHPRPISVLSTFGTLLFLIFLSIPGCISEKATQPVDEGIIVYEVSFPFDKDNPYINIYPREMTFTFKKDKVRAKLASFAEVVCSEFIIDNETKTFSQYFKVFDEKYKMDLNESEVQEMLASFPEMELHTTTELDSLAGMICAKSLAKFIDQSTAPIELYHTPNIELKSPNWCNQFSELHDVLLSYEIEQFGKRMRLTAKEIRYEAVPDAVFEAPKGFERIELNEMHNHIEDLVAQFEK